MKRLTAISVALLVTACSHNAVVRPVARGQFDVMARGVTETVALSDAYSGARDVCSNYVLLDRKSRYQGAVGATSGGLTQNTRRAASLEHFDKTIGMNVGYIVNLRIRCPRS